MKVVLVLVFLTLGACKRAPESSSVPNPQTGVQESDSRFFNVSAPESFLVSVFNMGDEAKVFPALTLKSKSATLVVAHDTTFAGMLLRDGAKSSIALQQERGGRLIIPIHRVPTKNGSCQGFVMSDPAGDCPKDTGAAECFPIAYVAHCETPFGKRFAAMGILAQQTSNAKLDPAAVEMAKTFDRIMATLEFKKF